MKNGECIIANRIRHLFVDVTVAVGGPAGELTLLEPQVDLALSGLDGITSVDDVATDNEAKVTTDGSGGRGGGAGGTDHGAGTGNNVLSLPDHGDDRSGGDEVDQSLEERSSLVLSVVLLSELLGDGDHLEADELETLALETGNDLTNLNE